MMESKFKEVILEFVQKFMFSNRKTLISQVKACVDDPEYPELATKTIIKVLASSLQYIYQEHDLLTKIEDIIKTLSSRWLKTTCLALTSCFQDKIEYMKQTSSACLSESTQAFCILKWTNIVLIEGHSNQEFTNSDELAKMMEMHPVLVHSICASNNKILQQHCHKELTRILKKHPGYAEVYTKVLRNTSSPLLAFYFVGVFLNYLSSVKDVESVNGLKNAYRDHYVELVVKSRDKLSDIKLSSCQSMLKYLTREDFKSNVWPAVDRFMLRNPEITLSCLVKLVAGVSIDLSDYALDIGKHLAAQCISKEESQCELAVNGSQLLAMQCTDPSATKKLLDHFFKVLSGSEGKLTLLSQKMNMLSAIGKFSQSPGSSLSEDITVSVITQFINHLQTESAESVATHAVWMMSQWTCKLTSIPPSFVQWVDKSLPNKTFSSGFRSPILLCLLSLKDEVLSGMVKSFPVVIQAFEKCISQTFQIQLATEAAHAACVVLKFVEINNTLISKCNSLWSALLDYDKQYLTNDKFLKTATKEALVSLSSVADLLLTMHQGRLNDKHKSMYCRSILMASLKADHESRKKILKNVKKIATTNEYVFILLNELSNVVESGKAFEQVDEEVDTRAACCKLLLDVYLVLAGCVGDGEKDSERFAEQTLVQTHHPLMCKFAPDTWLKLLNKVKVDPKKFVETSNVYELFRSSMITPSHMNALGILTRISPVKTFDFLRSEVTPIYSDPAYLKVTSDERVLLGWPEGELYDKSIVESKYEEKESNMKRENKLYSYKEQLVEIELKKELAKKNPAKEEVKLSKKQLEMIDEQLAKETNIRNKLKKLLSSLEHANKLVESCMSADSRQARLSLHWLLPLLVRTFKSVLAAPSAVEMFLKLQKIAFEDHETWLALRGTVLSQCILRLLAPKCSLDKNWAQESLVNQIERIVAWIFSTTQPKTNHESPFPPTTFNLIFLFLQSVIDQKMLPKEELLKCLTIMSCHMKPAPENSSDEASPLHLPRKQIMDLCVGIISTDVDFLHEEAETCLLDVCRVSNGGPGCVVASEEEINCLLEYIFSPTSVVRNVALKSLTVISKIFDVSDLSSEKTLRLLAILWMAKFDVDESNRGSAERLYGDFPLPDCRQFVDILTGFVVHSEYCVREASSSALAEALARHPQHVSHILNVLLQSYNEKLLIEPAVLDHFGRVLKEASPDDYPARCGITMALGKTSPLLDEKDIEVVFDFFISVGLVDRSSNVQSEMLNSALKVVNHGQKKMDYLLETFQEFLKNAPKTGKYDFARQSVVVLMGTLAKHLDAEHPVLKPVVLKLIDTLSTPSEQVQSAVANCLPPLVPPIKSDAPGLVKNLLTILLESDKYADRRGAAYGLAGFVKGLGILSLKQLDIISILSEAIQNKKNLKHREGALLAFELLCQTLGRLFEPYVVHLMPHLLVSFGDSSPQIRKAADETTRVVMSNLSAHGVKLVLPCLLTAIDNESNWRTRCGSVELLGAMAYCAPKQLSACLPNIVPKLLEVLTDSHVKVQAAGCQALKQIGSVIRNPEIQAVVPILLEALQDPTKKTNPALQKLLDTKFVHFIDSPSLALIMPVVQRALTDRSTETRKIAAQIVGNMYSLTDQKDLSPYLPTLVPGLKESLLNPTPEVRSASARAFGTMVRGMGEKGIDDLIPWLMQTLTSETSTVDRSGAAQGLSEVVGGLGLEKLNSLMPDIIQTANRVDISPNVRDGYIMMYIYLPSVFGEDFIPFVGSVIPSVLQALADETEYVRDTALRAGQRIVNQYADTAIELLLPEVEKGLFDDNWRIRFSSIQLLGDILFKISGVTGKQTTESMDDDDTFGSEASQASIMTVLGQERYNRVFAGLYISRQDTAHQVRQASLHVWKMIVTHTPRTLRNIMSDLFHMLLGCLASQSRDKRQVAARTLGDIVKKLGEKVLPEIIPILEQGLESEDSDQRQGVCVGLSEIMNATSRDHVILFADSLIPSMRKALCDPHPSVRKAAAQTFDVLHNNLGLRTLEDILPDLLFRLDDPQTSEHALDGLKQVMAVKSRVVLPYLIPQLISPPVNTKALCFLSSVAGEALTKHLPKILPAITASLALKMGTHEEDEEMQYCKQVVLSLHTEVTIRIAVDTLLAGANNVQLKATVGVAYLKLLFIFCDQSKLDLTEYIPQLLRALILLAAKKNEGIINTAWDCLNSIVKKLDTSSMLQYISHIRQAVKMATNDLKANEELPGFSIPKKGITPLVIILREGVLSGGPEIKESASLGLSEAIRRTAPDALKPSVVNITGAMIRILGDRFNFNVKVAMLDTLNLLLAKCGGSLKPFLPQLQTTFAKALVDTNKNVRLKAAEAMGRLVSIHNRIDALIVELVAQVKVAEEDDVRDSTIQCIRLCLVNPSCKINDKTQKELCQLLESLAATGADSTRVVAAACLGALCVCLDGDLLGTTVNSCLLDGDSSMDWMLRQTKSVSLSTALKYCPEKIVPLGKDKIKKSLMSFSMADRIPVGLSGLRGTAYFLSYQLVKEDSADEELMGALAKNMKVESNEVKQLVGQVISFVGQSTSHMQPNVGMLAALVPVALVGSKDKNTVVKSFSDQALFSVLQYQKDATTYQMCLESLEPPMKSLLSDAEKMLKKLASEPDSAEEDLDNTLLK